MFQTRDRHGDSYNVGRDIINFFPVIARATSYRLGTDAWSPLLADWAKHSELDPAELSDAATALAQFIVATTAGGTGTLADAWYQSGLLRLSKPAQVALLMQLGSGLMAAYFQSVRDSQRVGYTPRGTATTLELSEQIGHALAADSDRVRARRMAEIPETKVNG